MWYTNLPPNPTPAGSLNEGEGHDQVDCLFFPSDQLLPFPRQNHHSGKEMPEMLHLVDLHSWKETSEVNVPLQLLGPSSRPDLHEEQVGAMVGNNSITQPRSKPLFCERDHITIGLLEIIAKFVYQNHGNCLSLGSPHCLSETSVIQHYLLGNK